MRKILTILILLFVGSLFILPLFARPVGTTRIASLDASGSNSFIQSNTAINMGVDDAGQDLLAYGATSGAFALFDQSADEALFSDYDIHPEDDALILFGSLAAGDVTMQYDGTNFELFAAIADTPWAIGGTTAGFDITYAFETAGQFRVDYDADFVNLTDDMDLRFGTGGSADGDFQLSSTSGNLLTIGQVVAGTGTVAVGVDDAGIDWTFFGDTTAVTMKWTTASNLLAFTGQVNVMTFEGTTVDGVDTIIAVADPTTGNQTWTFPDLAVADSLAIMGSTLVTNAPEIANSVWGGTNQVIWEGSDADTEETVLEIADATADNTYILADDSGNVAYTPVGGTTYGAGAGAIPVTHTYVAYTSVGGAEALTLADGKPGQIIVIAHVTDGGNGVLTPATKAGWTSVDLADDGDTISLMFVDTSGWVVLGAAGVAAPPALTVP